MVFKAYISDITLILPPPLNSISLPIFIGFYAFWKIVKRSKWVTLDHMDFMTGRRELDEMDREEQEKYAKPTSIWGKIA